MNENTKQLTYVERLRIRQRDKRLANKKAPKPDIIREHRSRNMSWRPRNNANAPGNLYFAPDFDTLSANPCEMQDYFSSLLAPIPNINVDSVHAEVNMIRQIYDPKFSGNYVINNTNYKRVHKDPSLKHKVHSFCRQIGLYATPEEREVIICAINTLFGRSLESPLKPSHFDSVEGATNRVYRAIKNKYRHDSDPMEKFLDELLCAVEKPITIEFERYPNNDADIKAYLERRNLGKTFSVRTVGHVDGCAVREITFVKKGINVQFTLDTNSLQYQFIDFSLRRMLRYASILSKQDVSYYLDFNETGIRSKIANYISGGNSIAAMSLASKLMGYKLFCALCDPSQIHLFNKSTHTISVADNDGNSHNISFNYTLSDIDSIFQKSDSNLRTNQFSFVVPNQNWLDLISTAIMNYCASNHLENSQTLTNRSR